MFYPQVDPLLHIPVPYDLVHNHANGPRGDIVNDSSPAMVVLVGHTLLLSGVGLDVDDISDFVDSHKSGEGDHSLVLEPALEHVARTRPHTE